MNKRNRRLFMSFIALLILLSVALYIASGAGYFGKRKTTLKSEEYNFRIEDTAAVSAIKITDQDRNQIRLERVGPGEWKLNDKYKARIDAVDLILKTAKLIDMKSPVPHSARETIIRNLAVSYRKVEYLDEDGDMIKTWYVGFPTKDNVGSYMVLETPEYGKIENPYIMEIPGMAAELTSRFFTGEKDWRFTGVFNYHPNEIASVKVDNFDYITEGFEIRSPEVNKFELYDYKGKPIPSFDTVAVRAYLVNFKKIHFQSFNEGHLNAKQEDSLVRSQPFYKVSVTNREGSQKEITIYHKNPTIEDVDPEGKMYPHDTHRAYALLPGTKELVIIQFATFDKILWPVQAFLQH